MISLRTRFTQYYFKYYFDLLTDKANVCYTQIVKKNYDLNAQDESRVKSPKMKKKYKLVETKNMTITI